MYEGSAAARVSGLGSPLALVALSLVKLCQ